MNEAGKIAVQPMVRRVGIAIAQGVALWWLYDAVENGLWPPDQRGWLVGLIAALVLVPMAHYLVADLAPASRQAPVLSVLGLLALGLGWHHGAWTANEPYDDFLSFPAALGVLVFHALPFVQSALTRGAVRPQYADLFQFAWRNALLVALGFVFTGVFWLLLWLWGQLFHMLGIDAFRTLFESSPFAVPATAVAVGVGVQLAGSVERLQTALRQQLLAMLKWLAPLAILILALFTVALLVKSPELFAEQRRVISAVWLLWLVAMTVALLNAAYQDGSEEAPYPRWLGALIRHAAILLLPVALLAIYALGVRIDAYGLTVSRTWGLLAAIVAVAYAGGYAWAALRRGRWMAGIGAVNVGVALFTIAALMLMLTPVLSPQRLAAASVHGRILAQPDSDSYAYLRFESGRYGRERLAQLAKIEAHPAADEIRMLARREIGKKARWGPGPLGTALTADAFEVFPAGTDLDPALLAALGKSPEAYLLATCVTREPCPLLFADLDGDGTAEAIAFPDTGVVGARRKDGGWQMLDRMAGGGIGKVSDTENLRRALREGRYRIGNFPWQAIEIDGDRFLLAEPAQAPCDDTPAGANDATGKPAEGR
jgi:hypothetical protein